MNRQTQQVRYVASWCESDGPQGLDEFDPDLVVYGEKAFDTQKAATEHAIERAAKGPADDWFRVSEQVYKPYFYRGVDIGDWETTDTWLCDEYVAGDY